MNARAEMRYGGPDGRVNHTTVYRTGSSGRGPEYEQKANYLGMLAVRTHMAQTRFEDMLTALRGRYPLQI